MAEQVSISAKVELQEERAAVAALRARNLLLAQTLSQAFEIIAQREKTIAELTDSAAHSRNEDID